jgi:hypothetical protein
MSGAKSSPRVGQISILHDFQTQILILYPIFEKIQKYISAVIPPSSKGLAAKPMAASPSIPFEATGWTYL